MTKKLAWFVLLCLIMAGSLFAQTAGQIEGTVKDASGALIPGAQIDVLGQKQGEKRQTLSGDVGSFTLPQLRPETYQVTVTLPGFQEFKTTIDFGVGQTRSLDVVLQVAGSSSEIAVIAEMTAIDVTSARTGTNIGAREVVELPLNGRSYSHLALSAPGASNTTDGAFDKLRFNGKATEQNKFAFDGIDASAVFDTAPGWLTVSGSQFRLQNSVETIQEFRVDSALYPAEYGTGTGGQINVVSKSGGNQFHGAAFEYLRNDKLDARNFFDGDTKSKLRMNQYGFNLGGPIVRDKLFFFGSFEALRQRAGLNIIETVPSVAARARAVPEIAPLMGAFPLGFRATSNPDIDLAKREALSSLNETNFSGRVDYTVNNNHKVFLRYLKDVGNLDAPDNSVTPRRIKATNKPDNAVLTLNSSFGYYLFNEMKLGLNRAPTTLQVDPGFPGLDAVSFSVSGTIVQPGVNGGSPTGVASPGGLTRQSSAGNGRGSDYRGKSYTFLDNLSFVRNNHTFKTGIEFRALRVPLNQLGGLTYSYTNLTNFLANTGATVAYIGDLGFHVSQQEYYIGFFQDEWKLRSNVTLNVGLRYEYYTTNHEKNDRARVFDARTVQLVDPSTPFYASAKNAIGPRVGFTWSPGTSGKTVLRLGGGLYYGPGQFEDLMQPIESDVNRFSIGGQRYPVDPALLTSATPPPQTPRAYDIKGYRVPEQNIQFGTSIQQELPKTIVVTVGYTGSLGRNLFQRSITNLISSVNPATGAVTRQNPNFGEIDYKTSGGRDSYNAFQLGVSRKSATGLTISSQYTWAHSLGTSQGSNEAITAQDPFCFDCEKGDGSADIRHFLNNQLLFAIPFSGPARAVLGDWTVGFVANVRTGLPINPFVVRTDVVNVDATGRVVSTSGAPPAGGQAVINTPGGGSTRATRRPDLVSGVDPYLKNKSTGQWLNPAAFAMPVPGTYGNVARNSLRGPGFSQFDITLSKKMVFLETQNIEFRADVFNILNRANFANPPASLANALPALQPGQPFTEALVPGFGVITATIGRKVGLGTSRQIQLSVRYNF